MSRADFDASTEMVGNSKQIMYSIPHACRLWGHAACRAAIPGDGLLDSVF